MAYPTGFRRFSTSVVPAAHRIAHWERHNARALVGLAASPLGRESFDATELNLSLPRLGLARVKGSAHRVARDEAQIAAHPAGGVVVYVALQGTGRFIHRDGTDTVSPGQGILIDADQPFERVFTEGLTELAVKIPRDMLAGRASSTALVRPLVFDLGGSPHETPGSRISAVAGKAMSGRRVAWEPLEEHLITLVAELLTNGSAASHLEAAESFIRTHYRRQGLTGSGISTAVGLSERQLSRIFAASGRSIPQAILAVRLEGVRRLLSTKGLAHVPMSEIATRCGFSSQAQLSRNYHGHFGMPPLRHRRELLAEQKPVST